jgi:hypothetical protein
MIREVGGGGGGGGGVISVTAARHLRQSSCVCSISISTIATIGGASD